MTKEKNKFFLLNLFTLITFSLILYVDVDLKLLPRELYILPIGVLIFSPLSLLSIGGFFISVVFFSLVGPSADWNYVYVSSLLMSWTGLIFLLFYPFYYKKIYAKRLLVIGISIFSASLFFYEVLFPIVMGLFGLVCMLLSLIKKFNRYHYPMTVLGCAFLTCSYIFFDKYSRGNILTRLSAIPFFICLVLEIRKIYVLNSKKGNSGTENGAAAVGKGTE